jgi:hypothetical protein
MPDAEKEAPASGKQGVEGRGAVRSRDSLVILSHQHFMLPKELTLPAKGLKLLAIWNRNG